MKQEIEQLIDRLASKELTFGQRIKFVYEDGSRVDKDIYKLVSAYEFTPVGRKSKRFMVKMMTSPSFDVLHGNYPNQAAFWKHARLQGHPIRLDDVLKYMWKNWKGTYNDKVLELVDLWGKCRFESLQSIFEEAEWEEDLDMCKAHAEGGTPATCCCEIIFVPKQPHIRELFQFLLTLGL